MSPDRIIDSIHNLVYNNVYCSNPNDEKWAGIAANGYERRMIGFRAEIEIVRLLKKAGSVFFHGGWMLSPNKRNRCTDNSIYFTISQDEPAVYTQIFKLLKKTGFTKMFFIKYSFEKKGDDDIFQNGVPIAHPSYTCFDFDGTSFKDVTSGKFGLDNISDIFRVKSGKRYLSSFKLNPEKVAHIRSTLKSYSLEELQDILANRFIFDGILGFGRDKGIPSDIDLILNFKGGFLLLEVKEKDRAKTINGFGMDTERMRDMITISDRTGLPYFYVVREVNNQQERNFIDWWDIEIHNFEIATKESQTIEGGTGMATLTEDNHPTFVANISNFKKFNPDFS